MSDVYLTQCNRCANIYYNIYTHIYICIYIYIYLFFSTVYTPSLSIPVLLQTNSQELLMSNWGAPQPALCFFPTGLTGGCHIETDHRGTYVWHLPMAHHEGMILRLRPAPRVRLARANILIMHTFLILTHMYVSVS